MNDDTGTKSLVLAGLVCFLIIFFLPPFNWKSKDIAQKATESVVMRIVVDSVKMKAFADSVTKASKETIKVLADSLAMARRPKLIQKLLLDTVLIPQIDTQYVEVQVSTLKTLVISDSACHVENDSLRLRLQLAEAKEPEVQSSWVSFGYGFTAGVATCSILLGIFK